MFLISNNVLSFCDSLNFLALATLFNCIIAASGEISGSAGAVHEGFVRGRGERRCERERPSLIRPDRSGCSCARHPGGGNQSAAAQAVPTPDAVGKFAFSMAPEKLMEIRRVG